MYIYSKNIWGENAVQSHSKTTSVKSVKSVSAEKNPCTDSRGDSICALANNITEVCSDAKCPFIIHKRYFINSVTL